MRSASRNTHRETGLVVARTVGFCCAFCVSACAGTPSSPPSPSSDAGNVAPSAVSSSAPPASSTAQKIDAATSEPTVLAAKEIARDAELAPRAQAFLGAFTNSEAQITRSGAVLFSSNRDGIPQLYVGDVSRPKDPPRRLLTTTERIAAASLSADERFVLFSSDVGADRNFHVFRVGLDGAGLTDLTPGEKMHRDAPIVPRNGRGLFAYSAHVAASERTTVLVQHIDGGAPREIYSDSRGGELYDISPDGKHCLFARMNGDQDVVVFDIDVATSRAVRVYPPEGQPARLSASYSAAADRVFVGTQVEGHHAELLSIAAIAPNTVKTSSNADGAAPRVLARYEETILPNGAIDQIFVSPAGDRIAILVDGGNHSEVRLLDAHTLALVKTLDAPLGSISPTGFTQDGKRLTLSESRPNAPRDVFSADVRTGVVTPLRDEARAGFSAMAPLQSSIENIAAFDGLALPTNVYLPQEKKGKLPVIVLVHGGPAGSAYLRWSAGTRFFTSLGYAVVEPNIRGSTGFGVAFEKADNKEKRADALKDMESVNRWARAQPWCDPDRIVVMGTSYGGYMTLLVLGRQPDLWRAGVDASGMSDLRTMEKLEDQAIRVFDETEFGVLGKEDDLLVEWSPLKYVNAIKAPVFVYQGVGDPVTPQNEADQIVKALRERAVPVEYMLLQNEGHGIVRRENEAQYLARAARFLEEHAAAR